MQIHYFLNILSDKKMSENKGREIFKHSGKLFRWPQNEILQISIKTVNSV